MADQRTANPEYQLEVDTMMLDYLVWTAIDGLLFVLKVMIDPEPIRRETTTNGPNYDGRTDGFPLINGDVPLVNGDVPLVNGDAPLVNGNIPLVNGEVTEMTNVAAATRANEADEADDIVVRAQRIIDRAHNAHGK